MKYGNQNNIKKLKKKEFNKKIYLLKTIQNNLYFKNIFLCYLFGKNQQKCQY